MAIGSRLPELREAIARVAAGYPEPHQIAPGVSVFSSAQVTRPLQSIAECNLALVVQGSKRALLGGQAFEYGAGQFLVVTADVPLTSWITEASEQEPFLSAGIVFEPALIAELLVGLPPRAEGPRAGVVGEFTASAELLDAMLRLIELTSSPADYQVLARSVIREIHWRVLTGPQGAMVARIGRADGELAAVSRATAWLKANYDRPFRAGELAAAAGLSVSSVNRYFRRATTLSPLQYQKQLRLHGARMRLLSGQHDIAAVGHAVGYTSASQFAREYKRLFGRPPREDTGMAEAAVP